MPELTTFASRQPATYIAGTVFDEEITNSRDITETFDTGEGETTVRGVGTSPPIETSRVTSRKNQDSRAADTLVTHPPRQRPRLWRRRGSETGRARCPA